MFALALTTRLYPMPAWRIAAATLLFATITLCGWLGGAWRRGSLLGLVFAAPALVLPVGLAGECDPSGAMGVVLAVSCFAFGAIAGSEIAGVARLDRDPMAFAVAASGTQLLASLSGCGLFGLAAVLGAAAGVSTTLRLSTRSLG